MFEENAQGSATGKLMSLVPWETRERGACGANAEGGSYEVQTMYSYGCCYASALRWTGGVGPIRRGTCRHLHRAGTRGEGTGGVYPWWIRPVRLREKP